MLDMSNATAGGPSRGLLDMIFGSNTPSGKEADGKGFEGLMEILKAIKEETKDGDTPMAKDASWTEKETSKGEDAVDYRFKNIPELYAMMNPTFAISPPVPVMPKPVPQAVVPSADILPMAQASEKLLAKRMEILANSSPEMKVLFEAAKEIVALKAMVANSAITEAMPKMQQAKTAENILPEKIGLDMPKPVLPAAIVNPVVVMLAKELVSSGVNPQDMQAVKKFLKEFSSSKEASEMQAKLTEVNIAPDKLLSTESYLQMHQLARDPIADQKPSVEKSMKVPVERAENTSAIVVAGAEAKRNPKEDSDQLMDKKSGLGAKNPKLEEQKTPFYNSLDGALKETAESTKTVVLPTANQDEMRSGLMKEVSQSVHVQTVKGGGDMKMILHPENLGELKLKVGTRDGKVEVSVTAANEEVAGMLRKSSQDLASSLGEKNLTLSKFEVQVSDKQITATPDSRGGAMDQFLQQNSQQGTFGYQGGEDGRRQSEYRSIYGEKNETTPQVGEISKKRVNRSTNNRLDVVA